RPTRITPHSYNKISSGPPARYRLPLQRVNLDKKDDGTSELRQFTLGERRSKHPNKTVLLVGATGSGKSTLINSLVNFVMGVKFEDKVWFEVITDENKESQAQSQTTAVSVYEVFGFEGKTVPYSLTIIDTPGFGDTRGIEYDDTVTKQLKDLFSISGGVDSIDAVGLVLKATENRLDGNTAYIFNSLTSLFGKNMEQNIVALMTHSDGFKPKDALNALKEAKVKCARDKMDNPVYFIFNNRQKEPIDSDDEENAERVFMDSNRAMKKFTGFLENAMSQSVTESVEVMDKREQLTACIKNLMERVGTIEEKQKTIKTNQEMLEKYEKEIKENENFEIEMEEVYKVVKPIHHHKNDKAVTCGNCEENCHHPCDHWCFWCRNIFKDEKCTVCKGRCSTDRHVREKFIYETKTRTVKTTSKDIKAKYDESQKGMKTQTTLLEDLKFEMLELKQEKNKCLDDAFQCIERLEKIALNKDSASTCQHLDFLIKKMDEKGDTRKVDKLKSMKKRMNDSQKAAAKFNKKMKE
uniref:AIG1-type G domain-containing protein n=1 Tax=Neogobius melanostomus TaxID=47308 RepID=A0A8C6TM89_9GOBI